MPESKHSETLILKITLIKKKDISVFCFIFFSSVHLSAQQQISFEAGATYFSNNFESSYKNLFDFWAFTFNPQLQISSRAKSYTAVEFPFSLRSSGEKLSTRRFGINIPVLFTYNFGTNPGYSENKKKFRMGAMVGLGGSWFFQRSKSNPDEPLQYNESVSVFGPHFMAGLRFPFYKTVLFRINGKEVHPSLNIKFNYLFDLKNSQHNVNGVSFLFGLVF